MATKNNESKIEILRDWLKGNDKALEEWLKPKEDNSKDSYQGWTPITASNNYGGRKDYKPDQK